MKIMRSTGIIEIPQCGRFPEVEYCLLPTAREGNVLTGVCHSVHNRPSGYFVTAHPCWLLGHCSPLLQRVGTHPTGMLSCY